MIRNGGALLFLIFFFAFPHMTLAAGTELFWGVDALGNIYSIDTTATHMGAGVDAGYAYMADGTDYNTAYFCPGGSGGSGGSDYAGYAGLVGMNIISTGGLGNGGCAAAGDYYLILSGFTSGIGYYTDYYFKIHYDGAGHVTPVDDTCFSGDTRICSTIPTNGEIIAATSTSESVNASGYVNPDDNPDNNLTFEFSFYRQQNLQSASLGDAFAGLAPNSQVISVPATSLYNSLSTTTNAFGAIGHYYGTFSIKKPYSLFGFNFGAHTLAFKNVDFIVGTSTIVEKLGDEGRQLLDNATSTEAVNANCNILSSFNFVGCMSGLASLWFTPSDASVSSFASNLNSSLLTRFPFGYVYDFATILATTSSSSLTAIDATVPSGVPGTGSHIRLDLNHSLDFALNATSSIFNNSSASSTETLFAITNRYWSYLVYLAALIYIMSRIFGETVIPRNAFGDHGSLSDNNLNDDSYRLKEYLYKHRKQ